MGVEAVIATQVIDTTTVGRSLMTAADAAAARTALSLGTLATQNGTISDYLTAATASATYQTILVSGTSIKTVNGSSLLGSGDLAISGLSGTGSVDNAALRADGTGGATLQSSAWIINDNLTASPNNTVNHACLEATGGTTNVSVSIKPKGSGAFCLSPPDGTATGGNARGANAVDFQRTRSNAVQVASGTNAFLFPSTNSTASAESSTAGGFQATASGFGSWAYGQGPTASQLYAVAWGSSVVSGVCGFGTGLLGNVSGRAASCFGTSPNSYLMNQLTVGCRNFAVAGDSQATVAFPMSCFTSNATPTELLGRESFGPTTSRALLPANTAWSFEVVVVCRRQSGSDHATFARRGLIWRNTTAASTTIEGSVQTVGTDIVSAGAATWSIALSADTTNGALRIEFTGQAGTNIRTVAWLRMTEVAYS